MEKKSIDFKETLKQHNLTVNDLLDLKDEWYSLNPADRTEMLMEEYKKEKGLTNE